MAARKKSDEYVRLEAAISAMTDDLVRGLVRLLNEEIPARVREALAGLPSPKGAKAPKKGRKKKRSSR